jgi:polyisoprenyl-teichoic acid--peptidoglycan teichoic acid transferase
VSKYLVAEPPLPPNDGSRRFPHPSSGGGGTPRGRWKTIVAVVVGLLLILVGLAFGAIAYKMVVERKPWSTSLGEVVFHVPSPQTVFGKDRIYVMMLGIDYDYTDTDQPFSKNARSDTIMVAGLDFPTKSAKLISVLRDTDAMVDGHEAKINEAYSLGGVKLADQTIGNFLGMPANPDGRYFDRYIIIKINALKDFVNAIGGIDVPVTETMNYDDNWGHLHIHFKPGLVHMNGEEAQGYARFRHDACSDPCRTKRQQQVIRIVIQKLKADKFNDLTHIAQLISVFDRDVSTNLTNDEIKSLAWSFKDANLADLSHADTIGYVDTKETSDGQVVIPDEAQKAKLVGGLLGAYANAAPPPTNAIAAVKPSSVHVVVENGSGIAGLAGSAATRLRKLGYVVDSVGNADAFSYDTTQIRPASKVPYVGERLRADLGVGAATIAEATDATPGPRTVVTVIVGRDFAQAQATAAPTASTAPAH